MEIVPNRRHMEQLQAYRRHVEQCVRPVYTQGTVPDGTSTTGNMERALAYRKQMEQFEAFTGNLELFLGLYRQQQKFLAYKEPEEHNKFKHITVHLELQNVRLGLVEQF